MKSSSTYRLIVVAFFLITCNQINRNKNVDDNKVKDSIQTKQLPDLVLPKYSISDTCQCDSLSTKNIILRKDFTKDSVFNENKFPRSKFYNLDSQTNRLLWYRDIETPTKTKYTDLWNSYAPNNYYASPVDFLNYYSGKPNIELAFIFGPNSDLWAYHIFIVKRVNCCYLITRSYFRHNRFTYKAYAIITTSSLSNLHDIISRAHPKNIDSLNTHGYTGYFISNSFKKKFYIDFAKETIQEKDSSNTISVRPKPEILSLYEFVDKNINWKVSYDLK